jgi:CheY-like chemotaxis protein
MSGQAKGLRVLLIDDETGYLTVLAKRLRRRGLAVTAAPSGAAALQAMRREDFDVAVLDIKLHDMDGVEVLRFLKTLEPALEVLILTGHGSEQAARTALAQGAQGYLTKPCELEELLQAIHEAAGR